jgi:putative transposase
MEMQPFAASLKHTKWECKCHVAFIPKCRRKTLYEHLRRHPGQVFHKLAQQKESRIEEWRLMSDRLMTLVKLSCN